MMCHKKYHLALSNAPQVCTEVDGLQKSITVFASVDRSANTVCPVFAVDERHFLLPKYSWGRRQSSALRWRSGPVIEQATGPQQRSTMLQLDDASSTSCIVCRRSSLPAYTIDVFCCNAVYFARYIISSFHHCDRVSITLTYYFFTLYILQYKSHSFTLDKVHVCRIFRCFDNNNALSKFQKWN